MKKTNQEIIQIDANLDVFESNGKFTSKVANKITANKFEMLKAVKEAKEFGKLINEAFFKSINKKPEDLQSMTDEGKNEIEAKLNDYVKSHEPYQNWLKKEVSIEFTKITLDDLKGCEYSNVVMFYMVDTIFFK
jgi:hypothetical protein